MSEPNILVERHYIPLSVYIQIYSSNHMPTNLTLNTQHQNPHQHVLLTPTSMSAHITGNRQMFPHNSHNSRPTNRDTNFSMFSATNVGNTTNNDENTNTIRATRRTTVTIPNTTVDTETNQPRTATTSTPNSRIRIETMATGEENEINLFNALFAALINPSRLDSTNTSQTNGLTSEQITDNSTVMTYDNTSSDMDIQPRSTICSICTLEYEPQQQIRSLDTCDHAFHTGCIDRWLADHNTCPLCRARVIPSSGSTSSTQRTTRSTSASRVDLNGLEY